MLLYYIYITTTEGALQLIWMQTVTHMQYDTFFFRSLIRDEKRFKVYLLDSIDTNTATILHVNTCNRWLGIRLVS